MEDFHPPHFVNGWGLHGILYVGFRGCPSWTPGLDLKSRALGCVWEGALSHHCLLGFSLVWEGGLHFSMIGWLCGSLDFEALCIVSVSSPSSGLGIECRFFLDSLFFKESSGKVLDFFSIGWTGWEPVQQVAWWQPCFINALHCFDRFSLIWARNWALFVLLDSYSLRNFLVMFQIFSQPVEPIGN